MLGVKLFLSPITTLSLFIIFLLMPGFYINNELASYFRLFRFIVLGCLGLSVMIITLLNLFKNRVNKQLSIAICLHLGFLIYGFLGAELYGGIKFFKDSSLIIFLLISLILTYIFISLEEWYRQRNFLNVDVMSAFLEYFFILGFFILFFSGALSFNPLPIFHFERVDGDIVYSQATTSLFGFASVYFFHKASPKSNFKRLFYLFIALFYLALSAFGGARGDFLVSIVVIFLLLFRVYSIRSTLIILIGVFLMLMYFIITVDIEDILIFRRFVGVLNGETFGQRDVLFLQSIYLLQDKPICLITGCGFNYFQYYYETEFGLYPHNVIAELLITYGLFITIFILSLFLIGVCRIYLSNIGKSLLFYFSIFIFGLSLKSGTLVSMTLIPVLIFFAHSALSGFILRKHPR